MRNEDANQIEIVGSNWTAVHPRSAVSGPRSLRVDNVEILHDCVCAVGVMDDSSAVVDSVRGSRRANTDVVVVTGTLPFGSEIEFLHTYRYGNGFVRVITDLKIPRGTPAATSVEVGTLTLPGTWQRYRIVESQNDALTLTDWQALPAEEIIWEQAPLALILEHESGVQLEIGTGNDLWRWAKGVRDAGNSSRYVLSRTPTGLSFTRNVTFTSEPIEIRPRTYRFTWYLAWIAATESPAPAPESTIAPKTVDGGSLDIPDLQRQLLDNPNATIELDMWAFDWPASLLHDPRPAGENNPCLASSAVITRLRRIVRQLAAMENQDFPIVFRHLIPGVCTRGRHVDRKRPILHWDMSDLREFGLWARNCLGDDRQLFCSNKLDSPAMNDVFGILPVDDDTLPPFIYDDTENE